jgi:aldose 1-epimerase
MSDDLVLEADGVRLVVSATDGGRMRSLVVRDQELLVTTGFGPIMWGCYPFAPFAGRIRDGRFSFEGGTVELPPNLPPNAIHGTVFEQPWTIEGPGRMAIELGSPWPFRGRVTQWFSLHADGLEVRLRLKATDRMPAVLGWHPWFRRRLTGTPDRPMPAGDPAQLEFEPGQMYERDPDGLPTGRLVPPKPRPWDDCFTEVVGPPRLTWAGSLSLELSSSADHWVVYDELDHALCVEPQTGPPDDVNLGPRNVVAADESIETTMAWRWASVQVASADADRSTDVPA